MVKSLKSIFAKYFHRLGRFLISPISHSFRHHPERYQKMYSKAYNKFFTLATFLGIFPYKILEEGTIIDYHTSGFSRLWSTLNTLLLLGYLFYQLTMITISSVMGKVDKLGWFSQSCWLIMAIFPLPSIMLYTRKRKKMCECLTQWIQLERDLIGGIVFHL